jgi:hypothetical protein
MQITTITFFRFSGFSRRFWAFSRMGIAPVRVARTQGLRFFKFLGSGGGNGFSIAPNFGVYGLLAVWEDEAAAAQFFASHPVFKAYTQRATHTQTCYLRTTMAHGAWDGGCPFEVQGAFDPTRPAAVLTRATIRPRYYLRFWRYVPSVSRDVEGRTGLRFAVGVGELPIVQQATFSLWDSGKHMLDYAYRRADHAAVVRRTRELGWYKEELFARFEPYKTVGEGFF